MDLSIVSQKIYAQINQAQNILLVCHPQPDADAIGSLAAMSAWLSRLNKKHFKFCRDAVPANLGWLLDFELIGENIDGFFNQTFDLAIILDSSDLKYAGLDNIFSKLVKPPFLINIDHHATNSLFGQINVVMTQAASTTEIVYYLFQSLEFNFSPPVANCLLAGLIGDTYNFTNPNTTTESLRMASGLMANGASLTKVVNSVFKNKTVDTIQVWGRALERLYFNQEWQLVTTIVTEADLPLDLPLAEATEGTANLLNNLSGVKAVLILQQQPEGIIKGSFRTNDNLIDVSKLAKILGGGGHRKAAGFKIKGKLVQDKDGGWQIV